MIWMQLTTRFSAYCQGRMDSHANIAHSPSFSLGDMESNAAAGDTLETFEKADGQPCFECTT